VAFAPKVSHGVNTPAQEAVDAPVTAAPPHDGRKDRWRRAARTAFGATWLARGGNPGRGGETNRTTLVRRGRDLRPPREGRSSAAMAGIGEDHGSPRHPCLSHQRRTPS